MIIFISRVMFNNQLFRREEPWHVMVASFHGAMFLPVPALSHQDDGIEHRLGRLSMDMLVPSSGVPVFLSVR